MKKVMNYAFSVHWKRLKVLFLIMRLLSLLMIVGTLTVSAKSWSQQTKIDLQLSNSSVSNILLSIENSSRYLFIYDGNMINSLGRKSIDVKGQNIDEILKQLFQGTNVAYRIQDRQVFLYEKYNSTSGFPVEQGHINIKGRVSDQFGAPLPGVSVVVKGTTNGNITDVDGNYTLPNVPPNATLQFSFVGMEPQEILVENKSTINVMLKEQTVGIDEVVAIGYGTVKKKDLTGAVIQMNVGKLEKESTSNVTSLLRGSIPGLDVNFSTSAKGLSSPADMMVRGQKSLRSDNDNEKSANAPLIVVDGMIYYGDMADINPSDIETCDILKDASSAAIYGSRAANGVILITTKKGKKGKPIINVSSSVGIASLSNKTIHQDTPEQFIDWRIAGYEANERHQTDRGAGYYNSPDNLPSGVDLARWKAYDGSTQATDNTSVWLNRIGFSTIEINNYEAGKTVDWEKYLFQTGLTQDYNVSVSGSTDVLNYYWSLGYVDNQGFWYNEDFNNIRSRINLEAKITDWLKVGTNTQFAVRDESPEPASFNWYLTPYSSFYMDDGKTIMYAPSGNISASRHPWLDMKYHDRYLKYNTLNSKIYSTITFPLGISFTSEYITRFNWKREYNWYSAQWIDYAAQNGEAKRENTNIFEWQVNNMLKWNKKFGAHSFDFTLVQNAEKYQYWYDDMDRNYFQPNDYLGYHAMQSATSDITITSDDEKSTGAAYLARLNYIYKDRYLITGAFRRDGYSAFGQKHPWADFGSLALAWTLSQEKFFHVKWIDILKLRLSYGTNGNRGVGIYDALSNLATGKFVLINGSTETIVSQLYSSRMANQDLKWERTGAYNAGVDFSVLNGRLKGNIDAYLMKTTNLLMERQLPNVTGYASVYSNMGQVNNKGIEVSLNSTNIQKKDFSWTSNFTLSHNKNKIIHLFGDYSTDANGNKKEVDDITNGWFIGRSVDAIWNYKVLGIWQTSEKADAAKYSREPGDFKLWDKNGDGYYTNDDKVFQGHSQPTFRLSLRNDFRYRNWDLSVKMYSYLGYKSADNYRKNSSQFYDRGTAFQVPYWTADNPSNTWARISSYSSGFNVYDNNSFVRIDNVTLTYNLSKALISKIKVADCSVSFVAQNPYVYSPNWLWMDPEAQWYSPSYYSLKLNFTL